MAQSDYLHDRGTDALARDLARFPFHQTDQGKAERAEQERSRGRIVARILARSSGLPESRHGADRGRACL